MTDKKKHILSDDELENVEGGISMLTPAVQTVHAPPRKTVDSEPESQTLSDNIDLSS